jgi:hypothetical protein
LAIVDSDLSSVVVLHGDGLGAFGAATNYGVGLSPYALAAKDFNEDGKIDLVSSNFGSGGVSLLVNSCESANPVRDSGFKIRDSKFRIQDSKFGIQDSGFKIQDSGFNPISNPES